MDSLNLSQQQLTRLAVITRLTRGSLTEQEAAELLSRSVRQIRRMKHAVLVDGPQGIIHGNKGRRPWNKLDETLINRIVTLYETKYYGFNCLHFQDMLEQEDIHIRRESLRSIFHTHQFPQRKHRSKRRYARRERKPQSGLLVQQDTSFHDWFSTGITYALIASIDDATNEVVFARFFSSDGTLQNMEAMKTITETRGISVAFYVDRASHFRTTRHESIHVQLSGKYDETQIERALMTVGSTLILALSPQAKGRIERLFETLQDRLVKELKLAGVKTIEEGNQFLATWLPRFNQRFMVQPINNTPAWRHLPNHFNLLLVFSIQEERIVHNDNTISFGGSYYLLSSTKHRVSFAKAVVTIHQCIDGNLRILYKGEELSYTMAWTKSPGNS